MREDLNRNLEFSYLPLNSVRFIYHTKHNSAVRNLLRVKLQYLISYFTSFNISNIVDNKYTPPYSVPERVDDMEFTDLVPLTELLDDNIDDLEEALEPLLQSGLSDIAGKLPLLDKAHLYVLVTYAIESILFCMSTETNEALILIFVAYLRLNGVNSKEHPVFRELSRVKQYFEKIKAAESAGTKQNMMLDKAAAGRFIKYALVGCNTYATRLRVLTLTLGGK